MFRLATIAKKGNQFREGFKLRNNGTQTNMTLLKECGTLEHSSTINIALLTRNSRVQDLERKTNVRIEQVGKGGLPPLFPDH
jgi:hypothetical protein